MNTKAIINNLIGKGYRAAQTTIAALANFWSAADKASGYLNRKNSNSPVYSKSVPSRTKKPNLLRVSFIMNVTMNDGTDRNFYFNEFDVPLDIRKGDLDELAWQHAMNLINAHYQAQSAYLTYTSVIAV